LHLSKQGLIDHVAFGLAFTGPIAHQTLQDGGDLGHVAVTADRIVCGIVGGSSARVNAIVIGSGIAALMNQR
jgi:hypothetical protein